MNIGYMFQSYQEKPTGINRYTISLASEILKINFTDTFFAIDSNYLKLPIHESSKVITESGKDFANLIVRMKGIDLIHSFFNPFDKVRYSCNKMITVHDLIPMIHPEWFLPYMIPFFDKRIRKSCEMSDVIIAVSESTKADLINYYNVKEEKIRVVYEGISKGIDYSDVDEGIISKHSLDDGFFLFVSTIEERKNVGGLVDAFDIFRKANPNLNYKLVIAGNKRGDVPDSFISNIKERLGDAVVFPGYVTDEELSALYKYSTAVCYVSFYEGFGLPILEAMTAGKPVICSNNSSLPEVGGDAVLYCDPYDAESIADAMIKIVYDEHLADELQRKALSRAAEFSYAKAAKEIVEIYKTFE